MILTIYINIVGSFWLLLDWYWIGTGCYWIGIIDISMVIYNIITIFVIIISFNLFTI